MSEVNKDLLDDSGEYVRPQLTPKEVFQGIRWLVNTVGSVFWNTALMYFGTFFVTWAFGCLAAMGAAIIIGDFAAGGRLLAVAFIFGLLGLLFVIYVVTTITEHVDRKEYIDVVALLIPIVGLGFLGFLSGVAYSVDLPIWRELLR